MFCHRLQRPRLTALTRPNLPRQNGSSGSYCLHAATGFPQPAATGHCSHRLSTTMRPQVISDTGFPCGHMPCTGVDYGVQGSILICCYCNNVKRVRPVHHHQHQHQHHHQHQHQHQHQYQQQPQHQQQRALGDPGRMGWGNRPAGVGGTARPQHVNASLFNESKNPFRQAWLGKKCNIRHTMVDVVKHLCYFVLC